MSAEHIALVTGVLCKAIEKRTEKVGTKTFQRIGRFEVTGQYDVLQGQVNG